MCLAFPIGSTDAVHPHVIQFTNRRNSRQLSVNRGFEANIVAAYLLNPVDLLLDVAARHCQPKCTIFANLGRSMLAVMRFLRRTTCAHTHTVWHIVARLNANKCFEPILFMRSLVPRRSKPIAISQLTRSHSQPPQFTVCTIYDTISAFSTSSRELCFLAYGFSLFLPLTYCSMCWYSEMAGRRCTFFTFFYH